MTDRPRSRLPSDVRAFFAPSRVNPFVRYRRVVSLCAKEKVVHRVIKGKAHTDYKTLDHPRQLKLLTTRDIQIKGETGD